MNDPQWETQVETMARQIKFPPTPDIAEAVHARITAPRRATARPRMLKVAALILLLMTAAVLVVPGWRAQALDWLQIGAIRLVKENEVPAATVTTVASILDLPGHTTLENARSTVDFPIRLPADLREPDAVFVQHVPDAVVVLVWLEPDAAPLSLHQISSANRVIKKYAEMAEATEVNGELAMWLTEPHLVDYLPGDSMLIRRHVDSNVLLWEENAITYRLEGELTLEDALSIAEVTGIDVKPSPIEDHKEAHP